MSLIAEISTYNEDIGASRILRDILSSISGSGVGKDTQNYIKNTVCRGILQNDINISFTNNWASTAYQGIYDALNTASDVSVVGTNAVKVAKALFDVTNVASNMGGVSLVGAGAASTRIYQGSTISGFNVILKWYTPKDDTYIDSLKALLVLGFPSYRDVQSDNAHVGDGQSGAGILNFFGKLNDTLSSLASFNPPVLRLRVTDSENINDKKTEADIFNLYPVVISSINLSTSRETFTKGGHKIPIVITATVGFDFYQIRGNQGYIDPLMVAGVSVLGPMKNG